MNIEELPQDVLREIFLKLPLYTTWRRLRGVSWDIREKVERLIHVLMREHDELPDNAREFYLQARHSRLRWDYFVLAAYVLGPTGGKLRIYRACRVLSAPLKLVSNVMGQFVLALCSRNYESDVSRQEFDLIFGTDPQRQNESPVAATVIETLYLAHLKYQDRARDFTLPLTRGLLTMRTARLFGSQLLPLIDANRVNLTSLASYLRGGNSEFMSNVFQSLSTRRPCGLNRHFKAVEMVMSWDYHAWFLMLQGTVRGTDILDTLNDDEGDQLLSMLWKLLREVLLLAVLDASAAVEILLHDWNRVVLRGWKCLSSYCFYIEMFGTMMALHAFSPVLDRNLSALVATVVKGSVAAGVDFISTLLRRVERFLTPEERESIATAILTYLEPYPAFYEEFHNFFGRDEPANPFWPFSDVKKTLS